MTVQDQNPHGGSLVKDDETKPTSRRPFVEPEISQPVDVLEATTFFQAIDSGPTN